MPDHFGTLWIKGLKIIFELLNFIILSGKTGIVFLEDLTPGVMLECILGCFLEIMTSHAGFRCLSQTISATLFASPLKDPNILRIFRTLTFDLLSHRGKRSKKPFRNFFRQILERGVSIFICINWWNLQQVRNNNK